jgi:glutamate synthase (NADPH/NADH) large chain
LLGWESEVESFRKVMPTDYKRVLAVMRAAESEGLSEEETLQRVMEAAHG